MRLTPKALPTLMSLAGTAFVLVACGNDFDGLFQNPGGDLGPEDEEILPGGPDARAPTGRDGGLGSGAIIRCATEADQCSAICQPGQPCAPPECDARNCKLGCTNCRNGVFACDKDTTTCDVECTGQSDCSLRCDANQCNFECPPGVRCRLTCGEDTAVCILTRGGVRAPSCTGRSSSCELPP